MTTYNDDSTESRAPEMRKLPFAGLVFCALASLRLNRGAAKSSLPSVVATRLMALVVCALALATEARAALIRSGAGADGPAIQATVDQFRADLGPRREINWDGVPDNFAAPNFLPGDFFNSRGAFFSTPGTGVQVSADSSNPTSTPVRFGHINAT